ncbi:Di-copper centre-containing protein [Annulohypoxylon truncatum]|uniref:Di-copper centre-containing protein n=1 Tax=Annulohypoxylon truncatum TaxID=327061 RepID=UPI002008D14A|nr:Di-copper centre-containing protein [Annulohypoxylon truncatum]KAI1211502.1 Di-copper centre-containing protein [Annulohypoxylon truncatum]
MRLYSMVATMASMAQVALSTPCVGNSSGIPKPLEFKELESRYQANIRASLGLDGCTEKTIRIRKSWDDIDAAARADYVRAVKCLAAKPATVDKTLAPGAVNRLDDFTYIHINQTNIVHISGSFLSWHRIFVWQMEEALRNECGYKGTIPYWDQARFSQYPTNSKVFDNSSFGGDGEYLPNDHGPYNITIPGLAVNMSIVRPAGAGGGCVQDGPFANFQISLGPTDRPFIDPTNKFGYEPNPRCLKRNFDYPSSTDFMTWENAIKIVGASDFVTFYWNMENTWHVKSHQFLGKDGLDLFTSPNDPIFYLLHSQIDRLWAIWQGQNLEERTFAITGNRTFFGIPLDTAPNVPPSNATIEDIMDLGHGYRPKIKDGMPMTYSGRCYMYE